MIRALPFLVELILMIFCLVDAISAPEHRVRNLPKWAWILLILVVPLAGGIAWLVAGRPTAEAQRPWAPPGFPEYDRPGRAMAANPDDDEAFLRQVRERAEEQRRRYAEQKKREQEQQESDGPQE
ncbi:PLD nuclease N-terminal domain-containing protein [Nocardioides jiangxiensis]|uniref:PLD nuclease N-terminal domain-containing protein n=1 Tax=Nocardioides jiangxiensis TaxID=3064524 RepID=A0ABT9B6V3_9ACTN|nr:PLD nuclease N-terminal domain-containing protein [Nocardioides sp. WY-20]MDO7868863.1 PLD nuclease N-terminal domain-containing protein [Nocardioides sp. WY-20]